MNGFFVNIPAVKATDDNIMVQFIALVANYGISNTNVLGIP